MKSSFTIALLLLGMIILSSCTADSASQSVNPSAKINMDVEKIDYGSDICAFTGDTISVVRYGGRIVMDDGSVYNFKSAEGTAAFYLGMDDPSKVKSVKVVDFAHGAELLSVDRLKFLRSPLRPSPDGLFLTAVDAGNEKMLGYIYGAYPGQYLAWDEVLDVVRNEMDMERHQARTSIKKNRVE